VFGGSERKSKKRRQREEGHYEPVLYSAIKIRKELQPVQRTAELAADLSPDPKEDLTPRVSK